jgi:hypothetical protein
MQYVRIPLVGAKTLGAKVMGVTAVLLRTDLPVEFLVLFVAVTVAAALILLGVFVQAERERRQHKGDGRGGEP